MEIEIIILEDGKILLPKNHPLSRELAEAFGDEKAVKEYDDANSSMNILIGKAMCG